MWYTFALLSAMFASFRQTNEKQISHKLNHFTIGWTVQLLSLPIIFVALLAMGQLLNPFHLGIKFWLPTILIWFGFYPLNTFLYVNALKVGELSKTLPLKGGLAPIFALILGWLLINQKPTLLATIGIVVIALGIYVLNLTGKYLHNPLKIFTNDKANLYTLFSLLLSTLAGILDTVAMRASEPIYYCFVSTLGAAVALFVTAVLFKVKEYAQVKQNMMQLSLAGTAFGTSYAAYLLALNAGPLAYVTTIRSSSMLLGAMIGAIYLKESITRVKIIAVVLIAIGSIILGLNQ